MPETASSEPQEIEPQPRTVGMMRLLFQEVAALFRGRDSILREMYADSVRSVGETVGDDECLERLRNRHWERFGGQSEPAPVEIEEQERCMVAMARCSNLWILFWLLILPAILAVCVAANVMAHDEHLLARAFFFALVLIVLFPILAFCGLFVQSLFQRPFRAIVNRRWGVQLKDDGS
jgi:hypothetical protein